MVIRPAPSEYPGVKVWELGRNEWQEPVLVFEKPAISITFRPAKTHDKNAEITHGVNDCRMFIEVGGTEYIPEFGTGPTGFPKTVPSSVKQLMDTIQVMVPGKDLKNLPPISEKLFEAGLEGARKLRRDRNKGQADAAAKLAHKDHPAVPWEGYKKHADYARDVTVSTEEAVNDALED